MSFFPTLLSPTPFSVPVSTFILDGLFHFSALRESYLSATRAVASFALATLSNHKSIHRFLE